jgi:hypothetical protein
MRSTKKYKNSLPASNEGTMMYIIQHLSVLSDTYLAGKMPAPQEFHDLILYIISRDYDVHHTALIGVMRYISSGQDAHTTRVS